MGSEDNEKKRKHEEEEERNGLEEEKLKKKKSTGGEAGEETREGDGKDETGQSKLDSVSSTPDHVAGKNLSEKCLKLAKRAAELKLLKRGLKEVSKTIRKQQSGYRFEGCFQPRPFAAIRGEAVHQHDLFP